MGASALTDSPRRPAAKEPVWSSRAARVTVAFVSRSETPDSALARLFAKERASGAAHAFTVPGGATLYSAGDPANELYYLSAGRLGAFRREEGQEQQFLGIIRPGEPAGEMALIAGTDHTATVVALRDSEIWALSKAELFRDADRSVMAELARLVLERVRPPSRSANVGTPSVFGFIAIDEGEPIRPLIGQIAAAVEALGYSVAVAGADAAGMEAQWFSNLEAAHDFILYSAEFREEAWKQVVGRQVDRLFWVGHGERKPPKHINTYASEPLQAQQLVDLILLQTGTPHGSGAWLDATGAARIFHLTAGEVDDTARMARVLAGHSVGLVLSGGGARAYAHVGAVQALREHGVPIDFLGGSSMGGMVAAGVALGWGQEEMDARMRDAFVTSSPIADIAFPMVAMTGGRIVDERLAAHFGDTHISDLPLPFFCVSSNLTTGAYHLHKRGLLREALRASISLPGVLPPATDGEDVLVDGAVMKNFPADLMHAVHLGPIVGVDVSRGRSITAEQVKRPPFWSWLFTGGWMQGPPIVSLLMRAATVSTGRDLAASRAACDVLIQPKVDGIDIRDWKAYGPAVQAGYQAATEALAALDTPVTDLHKRGRRGAA
ncbi:MAG TPA: patatin-like phospholipase family protein [Caulobacteraceae bacterium]